jgi:hypothetical protein
MKLRALWDTALCSLVGVDGRFREAHCFHHQGDDGYSIHSEASVYF